MIDSSNEAGFLQKWWVLEAQQTWLDREDRSFLILDEDNAPLALFPMLLVISKKFKFAHRKRLESYGGLLITSAGKAIGASQVMNLSLEFARKQMRLDGADYIRFVVPNIRKNIIIQQRIESLTSIGVSVSKDATWVVDLKKTEEELWKNLTGSQRNIIRKAIRVNVNVREANERDLDVYYEMHKQTYSKNNLPPHPREYFSLIWNHFYPCKEAFILVAEQKGKVVAAQTFSMYDGIATYWTGASMEEAAKIGANALLQWEAMKYFQKIGYQYFENGWKSDVVGTKAASISKFKASFGGEPHPVYRFELLNQSLISKVCNNLTRILQSLR